MRALVAALRIAVALTPALARHQPVRLAKEIWENLRQESDLRHEARNMRRFVEALAGCEGVYIPALVDGLYAEAMVVQEMSSGRSILDAAVAPDGPRLARLLVDVYLHQFFRVGLFHGDPHPGNLFVMADGRLCLHYLGLIGFLDRRTRRHLALFLQAFVHQDAAWMLDAAVDLGLLGGRLDEAGLTRGIEEILADYAALPLKDWSITEVFLRITRLGSGESFVVPYNLAVLMRTMVLVEGTLRALDPDLQVLGTLLDRGEAALRSLAEDMAPPAAFARLKLEAGLALQELPATLATSLHRLRRDGLHTWRVSLPATTDAERHLGRIGDRLVLAILALGLYVAASLLMLHSVGPRLVGDLPLLAGIGYGLALWLTLRLLLTVGRSGRL